MGSDGPVGNAMIGQESWLGYGERALAMREEIRDVLFGYCNALDSKDFESVRRSFHKNAIVLSDGIERSVSEFCDFAEAHNQGIVGSSHLLSNTVFKEIADSGIRTESYCSAVRSRAEDVQIAQIRLRYLDIFTLQENRWRIIRREIVIDQRWQSDRRIDH